MRFQLDDFHRDVPDDEILSDIQHVAAALSSNGQLLTSRAYGKLGRFSPSTVAARFGSWNNALFRCELRPVQRRNVGQVELFDNILTVWTAKGKQPVFRDMGSAPSRFPASLYASRFGGWRQALREFVAYTQADEDVANSDNTVKATVEPSKIRTTRSIPLRLRFKILHRDRFSCQTCGASPAREQGIELHVDHVVPWSQGGETEESNLATKCHRCNLGKGDAFVG